MFRLSDMERFQSSWSLYDKDACGFIDTVDLLHLMQHLPEPWGFGGEEVKATQYQVSEGVGE
jgi:Ca2+-binding EF-hand superfamily protein